MVGEVGWGFGRGSTVKLSGRQRAWGLEWAERWIVEGFWQLFGVWLAHVVRLKAKDGDRFHHFIIYYITLLWIWVADLNLVSS